jgi:gelsolin
VRLSICPDEILDSKDVFVFDTGKKIWVWQGSGASHAEKALWIKVAQPYVRHLQKQSENDDAHPMPISKVVEGNETPAFFKALEA